MKVMEAIKKLFIHPPSSSEIDNKLEDHTGEIKHDLTNLKARIDVISRMMKEMKND